MPLPMMNQPQQQQGGGILQGLREFLFGASPAQMSTLTPEQEQFQQSLLPILMQLLQGGTPAGFQGIEENARRGFNTQTLPSLAERFAGIGGLGSSGYRNSLVGAGTQLESNLAALRGQYGQNQLSQLLGPSLQSNRAYLPGQPGLLHSLIGNFNQNAQGAGQALGKLAMGA